MADKIDNIKTRLAFDGEAEYKAACKELNSNLKLLGSEMKLVTAEYKNNATSTEALKAKQDVLQKTYDEQAKKVAETEKALKAMQAAQGENSEGAKRLETALNKQKAELAGTKNALDATEEALKKTGKQADDTKSKFSGLGAAVGTAAKAMAATMATMAAAAGAAVVALTKSAMEGYAEYEQLTGGVETLFKTSSQQVMDYANNAYKTAGMSANQYMETVTSFSASLLQSLGGDTEAAAKYADLAITDMADNANKMGTSMDMIQNAYQGFAKQNYTMLDNLKLGYGGTKEEMQRLLDDATKLSGVEYDISQYADVVEAIHVVQTEMGITGTTAKEASSTISGSFATMKSAWTNFLTGMANEDADFGSLVQNLSDSIVTVVDNIVPRLVETVPRLVNGLSELANTLASYLPGLLEQLLPPLMDGVSQLLNTLVASLPELLGVFAGVIPGLVDMIFTMLPQLIDAAVEIVLSLAQGLAEALPELAGAALTRNYSSNH